jgi:tetratricopeptide (TPR) repeat protein
MRAFLITVLCLGALAAGCSSVRRPPEEPVIEVAPPSSFEAAVKLYQAGELDRAEAILAGLRQSEPENARVALYLGRVHFEQKRYGEAVDQLEAAVALDDSDVDNWLWLGRALGEHVHEVLFFRKLPMAKHIHQVFLRAVELDPDSVEGQTALARFYSEAPAIAGGDRDKSLYHAGELIRLDPVAGHKLLSSIYVRFHEPEAAVRELRLAIEALAADGDRKGAEEELAEMRRHLEELQASASD